MVIDNWYMNIMENIAKNLSQVITSSQKPQSQIADEIGVSQSMVSRYATGKKFPALDTLVKLCRALDCTYEDILGQL